MSDELYFRLIQHIDALFDDGKLSNKDLVRLSAYALELGETSKNKSLKDAKKEKKSSSVKHNRDIDEIVSDVLAGNYR